LATAATPSVQNLPTDPPEFRPPVISQRLATWMIK